MIGRLNHLDKATVISRGEDLLAVRALRRRRPSVEDVLERLRRRLDLAAALVSEPKVLFLDEPTTGLDPQSRNDLWEVIEHLVDTGTTVLLTTQYLEEADHLASQLAVIDHGRVISSGTSAGAEASLGAAMLPVGARTCAAAASSAILAGS